MALPVDGGPSTVPGSEFRAPDDRTRVALVDWSRGGLGIQDASEGLNLYDWRGVLNDSNELVVEVPGIVAPTVLYTFPVQAVEIAFSFDTNMNTVIGWTDENDDAWFRWFDPTIPGHTNIELAAGSHSVRIALDDVRDSQADAGITDTVVAYMRSGAIYYRLLRDRFETEYEFETGYDSIYQLGRVGLNVQLRFQFELVGGLADE